MFFSIMENLQLYVCIVGGRLLEVIIFVAACRLAVHKNHVEKLTCQLTRDDKFSTMRRFSVRIGGGFRLKRGTKKRIYQLNYNSVRVND